MSQQDHLIDDQGEFPRHGWHDIADLAFPVSRAMVLDLVVHLLDRVPGNIVEFGVAEGHSTRSIRRALNATQWPQLVGPRRTIFACDSFEGLPEKFERAEVGTFACEPPKIRGVEIVKGYFEDSLTDELARRVGVVAFASLDADLYSSTTTALDWLTPLLVNGSLLLFDEYLGESESEKRAHDEWAVRTGVRTIKIAEFLRDPSGWGDTPDRRVLLQVIQDRAADAPRIVRPNDVSRKARKVGRRVARVAKPGNAPR
jgi:hypothetical protein